MARQSRLLIAEGEVPVTAKQLAARVGKPQEYIYRLMRAGTTIDGKAWRWMTDTEQTDFGAAGGPSKYPRQIIRCECADCKGRTWTPAEIFKEFPRIGGQSISPKTIANVARECGHEFAYVVEEVPRTSEWRRPADLPDTRKLPSPGPLDYSPRVRCTDPDAIDTLPINPWGPGARR